MNKKAAKKTLFVHCGADCATSARSGAKFFWFFFSKKERLTYFKEALMDDGLKQFQIAILLLWVGLVFGVVNIMGHVFFIWQATGQLTGAPPLLVTAALFIFVQGRLILAVGSRNAKVRDRLAFVTLIRILLIGANVPALLAISPLLVVPPVAGAVFQISALIMLYVPPGSLVFARPAEPRR